MAIDLEEPPGENYEENRRSKVDELPADGIREPLNVDVHVISPPSTSRPGMAESRPSPSTTVSDPQPNDLATEDGNVNSPGSREPYEGMVFATKEDAFSFYINYARLMGFVAVTRASRRSKASGKFIAAKYACSRHGNNKKSGYLTDDMRELAGIPRRVRIRQSLLKTDCKATLHVKQRRDGKWIVCTFIKEHNHEISPDHAYFYRGQRSLGEMKRPVDSLCAIRARTKKVYTSMTRQSGGAAKLCKRENVTCQPDNCRQLSLEEGDAQLMLGHFMTMQEENPNFFYALDLNQKLCLRNVLWIDAKGRLDYGSFGDVILFDTSYRRTEYKLPLAVFVGVNHHCQPLLLGFALVADDTKFTYLWLMRAWLRAVGGCAPQFILTDLNEALKEAVPEVFPQSRHCYSLWHVLSKVSERIGRSVDQDEEFMRKFNKCMFKSSSTQQFESRWIKMMGKFNMAADSWFQSLYDDRWRWAPPYLTNAFLAGMSTAQRSDSPVSFLDKYIHRKTTLKELLEQLKTILLERCEGEAKADFENLHKQPGLKSPSPFGKQMASLYTHTVFKKFQVEVLGVVACLPTKDSEDGEIKTFRVQDFEENQSLMVVQNVKTSELSCSCRMFEYSGFLCRHVLIVLQMSGVHNIPSQYILRRWTKDAKGRNSLSRSSSDMLSRVQRYNDICQRAFTLGDEGSLTQESYNVAFSALEEASRKCESINSSMPNRMDPVTFPTCENAQAMIRGNTTAGTQKIVASQKDKVHPDTDLVMVGMNQSWRQMGPSTMQECYDSSQGSLPGLNTVEFVANPGF